MNKPPKRLKNGQECLCPDIDQCETAMGCLRLPGSKQNGAGRCGICGELRSSEELLQAAINVQQYLALDGKNMPALDRAIAKAKGK